MPDKTPLELAQRILAAESPSGMGWSEVCKAVAAALVERLKPVEISPYPTTQHGAAGHTCPSCKGGFIAVPMYPDWEFCPRCGKPLVWK